MYSEYTRNRILALFNADKTPTEIVIIPREENIVVVRTTVARIIRRTRKKKQGQELQDHRGRPPKAIEPLWHELKWYIRKHVKPKTKDELVTGIREFWRTRVKKEKCQRYINHVRTKVVPRVVEL